MKPVQRYHDHAAGQHSNSRPEPSPDACALKASQKLPNVSLAMLMYWRLLGKPAKQVWHDAAGLPARQTRCDPCVQSNCRKSGQENVLRENLVSFALTGVGPHTLTQVQMLLTYVQGGS